MYDIDNHPLEFPCPGCGFYNRIFFKQARLRGVIICRGCKSNIQLDDKMNECRKAKRFIREALRGLKESIENISF